MNNTQKLIIAQRKLIKHLKIYCNTESCMACYKLTTKIAKLEKKIIKEENR